MTWAERHACVRLPTTELSAFMAPTIADFGNSREHDVRGDAHALSIGQAGSPGSQRG